MKIQHSVLALLMIFIPSLGLFGWGDNDNGWTAEQLAKYVTEQTYQYDTLKFVDPEKYVTFDQKIYELMNKIKAQTGFETQLFVISQMSNKYSTWSDKNIELFVQDLSYLLLKGDTEKDKISLFILFSIKDRQMRIRTGESVKKLLSDSKCVSYLDELKPDLRSFDYQVACEKLLQRILDKLTLGDSFISSIWDEYAGWIIFFIIIVILGFIGYMSDSNVSLESRDEQKLNKMRDLLKSKKAKRQIINETCIICLENLEEQKSCEATQNLDKSPQQDSEQESFLNKNLKSTIEREEEGIKKQPKIEEVKGTSVAGAQSDQKPDEIARLECGHSFHLQCITNWMTKKNECPICREKIDKNEGSTNQRDFQTALTNIQTVYHPSFSRLEFSFIGDELRWHRRVTYSRNKTSSSYSRSWGHSGGGGSSKW